MEQASHLPKPNMIALMIDMGIVDEYDAVQYIQKKVDARTGRKVKGRLTRDGIECNCCLQLWTLSKFEVHAGSKRHRPATNVFLIKDGRSLSECHEQAKLKAAEMRSKAMLMGKAGMGQKIVASSKHSASVNAAERHLLQAGSVVIRTDTCSNDIHVKSISNEVSTECIEEISVQASDEEIFSSLTPIIEDALLTEVLTLESAMNQNIIPAAASPLSDSYDQVCGICNESGYVICCDGCPALFHLSCLQLQETDPECNWYCSAWSCANCKLGKNIETQMDGLRL